MTLDDRDTRVLTGCLVVAWLVACQGPPALKVDAHEAELVRGLQRALSRSVENEKLAAASSNPT